MYFGFVVRHVARKILVATTVMAAVSLATKTGRRVARIGLSAIAGATKAAAIEMRTPSRH
jgi:hypothetical protein